MKDLLIRIAQALVDDPGQVRVTEIKAAQEIVLELRVAKSDMGKILGKQGRTANAIRALLIAASGKAWRKYRLEIVELYGGFDLWKDGLGLKAVIYDICNYQELASACVYGK